MSASDYLQGVVFCAVMLAGTGIAAVLVARLAPRLPAAGRVTQVGILWLFAIFVVHVVPGMLGLLERTAVAVASVVLAVAVWLVVRRTGAGAAAEHYPKSEPSGGRSWLFAGVAAAATAVMVVVMAVGDADVAPFHVDVVSFHLPNVARWIQTKTLWQVDDFIPDRSPGDYPETGDLFSLAAMLPWRSDFLVRFVNYPLLAITATGTYGLARELRVPAATSVVTTAAFIATPLVAWGAFAGLADVAMLAGFAGGCYFLVRHSRTDARMDLLLAGLGLGLSFGTRWYAVPAVAAVVGVWLAVRLLSPRDRRSTLTAFAGLAGLIALAGGFWLVRNWVESGNPVFPVKVAPLGVTIFDAPTDVFRDLQGFTLAHYADRPSIFRHILFPGFLRAMGAASIALWLGLAAAGGWAAWLWRRSRAAGPADRTLVLVGALVAAAALIGVIYVITPYSATGEADKPLFAWVNSRYVAPALVLGVAATAWAITRTGRWRQSFELVMALAALDGVRRVNGLQGPDLGLRSVAVAILILAAAGLVALGARRLIGDARRRPGLAAAAAVGLLVLVVAAGRVQERDYRQNRYAGVSPPITYVNSAAPTRVALVGEGWGNYPFFGPQLRNDVQFVGKRVRGTYRNYGRRAGFDAAMARGRFGLVVFHDYASIDQTLPARQEHWLRALGYRAVATGTPPYAYGSRMTIYLPPGRRAGRL